jgi:plasmid stabilization system protein ParE
MARVIRSPRAKRDIVEVLQHTKERWGVDQAREYAELIQDALVARFPPFERDPTNGTLHRGLTPAAWRVPGAHVLVASGRLG